MPDPFAAETGRGVRVAVIDSGVHASHPHIREVAGGIGFGPDGSAIEPPEGLIDRLGHGTAVMAAIQEKAPDATCFAVRVFEQALRTRASNLVAAIDWCARNRIDLVNLSLGTVNPAHESAFAGAVERARAAGCVLIAARTANRIPCLPGSLPDVLGVELDWDCPRQGYRVWAENFTSGLAASGFPRPAPGVAPTRNLHGISFAVANMTGIAARARERLGGGTPTLHLRAALSALLSEEIA